MRLLKFLNINKNLEDKRNLFTHFLIMKFSIAIAIDGLAQMRANPPCQQDAEIRRY